MYDFPLPILVKDFPDFKLLLIEVKGIAKELRHRARGWMANISVLPNQFFAFEQRISSL